MGWLQTTLLVVNLMQRVHGIRGRPHKAKPVDYLIQIYEVLKTGMQWNRLKGPLHWSTYYLLCSFKIALKIIPHNRG